MAYEDQVPLVNKFLQPDGSITTLDGTPLYPADERRAKEWESRAPLANKVLNADGSISGLPSGGGGGGNGGGLNSVAHDGTLGGNGTTADPLKVVEQEYGLNNTESGELPSIYPESVAAKLQEFYSLCSFFKNNMLVPIGWWPRIVLSFMHDGEVIANLDKTTELALEPLTDSDRSGWTLILDNSQQGGDGAEGILRLVYNSDTDWYVEGKAWHLEDFSKVIEYSADAPGYSYYDSFDGNGGAINVISGDIADSSIAKVLYPEAQLRVDLRTLVDVMVVNTISNNVIRGINTFLRPPQVPTPEEDSDAANMGFVKAYVDAKLAAGS